MLRYADMFPEDLAAQWESGAAAVVPWGALEWHGPHLPTGLDGVVAEGFASRLPGVLLPTFWVPISTLPHPTSICFPASAVSDLWTGMLLRLGMQGVRTICVVTGHYAQGHLWELYEVAEWAMKRFPDLRVLAAAVLEPLGEEDLLDHAGFSEASMHLALGGPARLDLLPEVLDPAQHAVLGPAPHLPDRATAEHGERLLQRAEAAWRDWMATATQASLADHYAARREVIREYRETFYAGDWDEALQRWWAGKTDPAR